MEQFIIEIDLIMNVFFNEISANYATANLFDARKRMADFIEVLKGSNQKGFLACKMAHNFENKPLTDSYTIRNWLNDSDVKKDLKDFYLSFRSMPFEGGIEETMEHFYYLNEPAETTHHNSVVEGLAWTHICGTLAVSFPSNAVWQKHLINIEKEEDEQRNNFVVNNLSLLTHIASHTAFIDSIIEPVLIPTIIRLQDKQIHLAPDHHGYDKLHELGERLITCQYVEGILNSLDFDRYGKSFIRRVHPNNLIGCIDVTLIDEDDGYSIRVKTTGRTLRESQEIANILKDYY